MAAKTTFLKHVDVPLLLPISPASFVELEVFANSCICFIKRPCLNFGLYPVSIACLQSER